MRGKKPRQPTYARPDLYPKQEQAIFTPARYAIIEATPQSGKEVCPWEARNRVN